MPRRIILVGGGSGGHVVPLVAVAGALRKLDPSVELLLLGEGPFLILAAKEASLPYKTILAGKWRRYFSLWNIFTPFQMAVGFVQSLWILFWYMPDYVFTKGGYTSVMPALVAKLYNIPIYTHESDSVPGMANKFISKLSRTVFTSFESSAKWFKPDRIVLTGNPIRPEVLTGERADAFKKFNLRADKKTVLVAGGSQGSKRINDAILEALVLLVQKFQVIHQTGDSKFAAVKAVADQYMKEGEQSYGSMLSANYRAFPFLNVSEMAMAYAAADVVISRGGASNLFEIAALGKPAIIIPLSLVASRGDQIDNAAEFAKYGAVVIEEANVTSHIIINQLEELLKPEVYAAVSAKIKSFAKPDAANKIAQTLLG